MSPRHKRHVDAGTTWYSFLGAVYTGDFIGDFLLKAVFLNSVFINKHTLCTIIVFVPLKNSCRKLLFQAKIINVAKKLPTVINKIAKKLRGQF